MTHFLLLYLLTTIKIRIRNVIPIYFVVVYNVIIIVIIKEVKNLSNIRIKINIVETLWYK